MAFFVLVVLVGLLAPLSPVEALQACSVSGWATLRSVTSTETTVSLMSYQCAGTLDFSFFTAATSITLWSATFGSPLSIVNLPSSVTSLTIWACTFTSSVALGSLPSTLQSFSFYSNTVQGTLSLSLPSTLSTFSLTTTQIAGDLRVTGMQASASVSSLQFTGSSTPTLSLSSSSGHFTWLSVFSCAFPAGVRLNLL
eukprot:RCo033468